VHFNRCEVEIIIFLEINRTNQEEIRLKSIHDLNTTAGSYEEDLEFDFTQDLDWNYFWIFCGLVGAVILSVIVTILGFFKFSMTIGVNIHDAMFSSLVRSPVKFFDENPSGTPSILNF